MHCDSWCLYCGSLQSNLVTSDADIVSVEAVEALGAVIRGVGAMA